MGQAAVIDFPRFQTGADKAKPFIKWVGGKRSIIPELMSRVPSLYDKYVEGFLGGGALFYELQPHTAVISDINLNLIRMYAAVRDDVEAVMLLLEKHKTAHDKPHFLKVRSSFADIECDIELAAAFIYLNKTCYNGLYRVNKSGKFNVPMGSYKNPKILDDVNLRNASNALRGVKIVQRSFEHIEPEPNVFYYFDPPYHETYDGYNKSGFADTEHKKLADLCRRIDKAGGMFMLSNSDTDFVRGLYKGFLIEDVLAGRMVSCKSNQRGKKNEFLIRNYG